jgi:hypothetical protein
MEPAHQRMRPPSAQPAPPNCRPEPRGCKHLCRPARLSRIPGSLPRRAGRNRTQQSHAGCQLSRSIAGRSSRRRLRRR